MKKQNLIYLVAAFVMAMIMSMPSVLMGQAQAQNDNIVCLAATDGQATIAGASDVFAVYIDPRFDKIKNAQAATLSVDVQVRDIKSDGTIQEIFCAVSENLDQLCLTQSQIKEFCKNHAARLRSNGLATFFLSKEKGRYFVTEVYGFDNALHARYLPLFDPYVWNGEYRHKIVVAVR